MSPARLPRVLGVIASPRRNGNTAALIDAMLAAAAALGAATDRVFLDELHIGPCRACDTCRVTGRCAQQDDMANVLDRMAQADVWLLGTPIYMAGPTAQFKTFVDRWHARGGPRRQEFYEGKKAILAIPFGATDPLNAFYTLAIMRDVFDYHGGKLVASVLAPGCSAPGDVLRHEAVLAQARAAVRDALTG